MRRPPTMRAAVHSRSKQDEAHRNEPGDGVVPYAKPLVRSNKVLRRLLNEHPYHNTKRRAIFYLPAKYGALLTAYFTPHPLTC